MNDKLDGHDVDAAAKVAEPHGQAALLLAESLLHGLIASSSLTVEQAVEIVQIAVEVKQDMADGAADTAADRRSLHLLNAISASLRNDLPRSGTKADGNP